MCTGAFWAENSHHSNIHIPDSNNLILTCPLFISCGLAHRPIMVGHAPVCPRAEGLPPVAGPSGLAALSLRRTGLPGRRSCPGAREGSFSGRWILGKSGCLLILLADNYNRATTGHHRGTERTEYAQRLFGGGFEAVYGLTILASGGPAAPGSPSTWTNPSGLTSLVYRAGAYAAPARARVHVWAFGLGGRENVTAFNGNSDL